MEQNLLIIKLLYRILEAQEEMLILLKNGLNNENQPQPQALESNGELMTRQEVKDYLAISEATYKRKVKDGSLKPMKVPGGHRFYKHDLEAAFKESIRRGRI
ncbi:hypothetical protein D9M68_530320 [compost metagenome]